MATDNITFGRYERDCPANKNRRAGSRPLFYDFRVVIDGEYRAILSKGSNSYRLYDPDYRPILTDADAASVYFPKHMGSEVKKQDDFFQFVADNLHRIPTAEQLAETRRKESDLRAEIRRKAEQAVRDRKAEHCGPSLLAALKAVVAEIDREAGGVLDPMHPISIQAENAKAEIARAEHVGTSEAFDAAVESIEWQMKREAGLL